MTDEKVRQLRAVAGAEMARKWLTASRPKPGDGSTAHDDKIWSKAP